MRQEIASRERHDTRSAVAIYVFHTQYGLSLGKRSLTSGFQSAVSNLPVSYGGIDVKPVQRRVGRAILRAHKIHASPCGITLAARIDAQDKGVGVASGR